MPLAELFNITNIPRASFGISSGYAGMHSVDASDVDWSAVQSVNISKAAHRWTVAVEFFNRPDAVVDRLRTAPEAETVGRRLGNEHGVPVRMFDGLEGVAA